MSVPHGSFRDHFGPAAREYACFRPGYPRALYEAIMATVLRRSAAWDCATGSGQAAQALAEYFDAVVATDASPRQLAAATKHPRVRYVACAAERAAVRGRSVSLVTVAQAIHWFDRAAFYAECRRVLEPDGVVAVWGYGLIRATPALDAVIDALYHETLGPFWPSERRLIDEAYRGIDFPFRTLPWPALILETSTDVDALCGYFGTWSAVRGFRAAHGRDPIAAVRPRLVDAAGDAAARFTVRWPLFGYLGRVD